MAKKVKAASVAVTAILLVTVAENGINPKKFPKRIKKKIVKRYGRNLS